MVGPGFSWHGWQALGAGVYVGLFEMGVAFILWQMAVRKVSRTAKVSNLIFLSPPISLLLLYLVVNEPLLVSTLVGLMLNPFRASAAAAAIFESLALGA